MRFVILLGALALLALSSTAEDQDKAIDLAGKDILIREVRDDESKKSRKNVRKSKRRNTRKKQQINEKGKEKGKGNEKEKEKGKRKGKEKGKRNRNKGKKAGRRKGKKRTLNGRKFLVSRTNGRQLPPTDNCDAFYNKLDTAAVRDLRYARNQIQKARRAKKRIEKLDRLTLKAATAFLEGAAFYQACWALGAPAVYEGLSQCNVTAANACNPADLKNTTDYSDIDLCITALEATMNSSDNCLSKGECGANGTCNYEPIGMVNRTCDYGKFDRDVANLLNKKCSNSTFVGSFTYCNNLLKDSYPIASNCICLPPTMTTLAPSSGRLRNNLNIWKI